MRGDLGRLFLGSSASKALLLSFELGLAARLGAELFGLFSIAFAFQLSAALLLLFGWQFGIVNRVSVYLERGDKKRAGSVVLASATAALALGGFAGLLLGFSAGWISNVVFSKPELEPFLLAVAFALPAEMLNLVISANLRGRRQFITNSIVMDGARNFGLMLLLLLSVLKEDVLIDLLPWWLLTSWLGTLPGAAILWRDSASPTFQNAVEGMASLWQFSSWLGPWAVLQQAGSRLQMLLAAAYLSTTMMGVIAVLLRLTQAMNFLQTIVNQVSGPRLARIIDRGDRIALCWTFRRLASLMALASGLAALTMMAFAAPILGMFGQVFAVHAPALTSLLLAQLIVTGSGPAGQILIHGGWHRRLLAISALAVTMLVVVGVPSYAWLGLTGFLMTFALIAITTTYVQQRSVLRYFNCHGVTPTLLTGVAVNASLAVYLVFREASMDKFQVTTIVLIAGVLMLTPFAAAMKKKPPVQQ